MIMPFLSRHFQSCNKSLYYNINQACLGLFWKNISSCMDHGSHLDLWLIFSQYGPRTWFISYETDYLPRSQMDQAQKLHCGYEQSLLNNSPLMILVVAEDSVLRQAVIKK